GNGGVGLYYWGSAEPEGTAPIVTNCVFWGNDGEIDVVPGLLNPIVTYCNVQGGYEGTGNINADPSFFFALRMYGRHFDDLSSNYHLKPVSPCIDSGTDAAALSTDRDGNPRLGGPACDMGAYEHGTVSAEGNDAQYISQSIPSSLSTGESATVAVTMRNNGTSPWTSEAGYKLGTQNPHDNTVWGFGSRVGLAADESVAPGQEKTFTFEIRAPLTPGEHNFQMRMVREGVEWFGEWSTTVVVSVRGLQPNDSRLVSQNVPNGLAAGETATVSLTMKNNGTNTWTSAAGHKLGTQNPHDNTVWGFGRVDLAGDESVAPGQEKTFTFEITAPSTPGNHDFQMRMVREGFEWFGESSTNVVVNVRSLQPNDARFISQSVPSGLSAGETATVSVTMKNNGTNTWTPGAGYKLGTQNPQDNTVWGFGTRVDLAEGESIDPGQEKTFTFEIRAPSNPGTYNFQMRMVQEGVAWFGDCSTNMAITVQRVHANDARFVSQNIPSSLVAGESATVSVTMKNNGTNTWTSAAGYRLGTQNPQDNTTWGFGTRVGLAENGSIAPGQERTFTFEITAPPTPGAYNFQMRMVRESVEWFGDCSTNIVIIVRSPQANDARFVSQNIPNSLLAGRSATVSVTMKNNGTNTWTSASGYGLGTQNPEDNTVWGFGNRVGLGAGESIAPGQEKTFAFEITTPSTPGAYNFQMRMAQEDVEWFGDSSPNAIIPVQANGITINGEATYTRSASVTLSLSATDPIDVTQMQFSDDGVNWGAATAYAANKTYSLPAGDGHKTVYVKFGNAEGHWSTPVSDTITLDTTPPVTTASSSGIYTTSRMVSLWAEDSLSGVDKVYYTVDGNTPTKSSLAYAGPILISVTTTLKYFAVDAAGNSEAVKSQTYNLSGPGSAETVNYIYDDEGRLVRIEHLPGFTAEVRYEEHGTQVPAIPGMSVSAAPTNLTATKVSPSRIDLAWVDNANNETGYKIERKLGAEGTYSVIATLGPNASAFADTQVAWESTYYYRVRAYNSIDYSAYSNEASASTTW
ncbi:MAG: NBR1-Ig-like domain-containing protein, partial [Pseudomonadota bacterium]